MRDCQKVLKSSQKDRKRHRQSDKFRRSMTVLRDQVWGRNFVVLEVAEEMDEKGKLRIKWALNAGEPSHC
jgi:hypothetical protein